MSFQFRFADHMFEARSSGALWWPEAGMLVVSDLHLGRAGRYARRGGALLPPYADRDTLDRLEAEVAALDPATVLSLGDSFDDDLAARELPAAERARLMQLARGRDWLWVQGNHDPALPMAELPGRVLEDWGELPIFRHIPLGNGPEVAGHYHPVLPLAGRRWRCFAMDAALLILPAFGLYTGGLDLREPGSPFHHRRGVALICAERVFPVPFG